MGLMDVSVNKVDNYEKLAGEAVYIDDMRFEGMCYVKTFRSTKAKAAIKGIHLPEIPEGCHIVTWEDIPGINSVKIIYEDMPVLARDRVSYIGEPILLVVGRDKAVIEAVMADIVVDYEEETPIPDMDRAIELGNFAVSYNYEKGDVSAAFARADSVFEQDYRTGHQEHVYMEPQGVIGLYEAGKATIYGSIQCPYYVKAAVMQTMDLDSDSVRIIQTTTGGAFGGKEEYPSLLADHAALAARKSGKPVKLLFDRKEDMAVTTKRHPSLIKYKAAVKDGRITALDVEVYLDGGAYIGLSNVVLQRAMITSCGVYVIPNVRVHGRVCRTNTVPTGAFRGFGGPQALFAIEMCMNHVAKAIGRDPVNFKSEHLAKQGDLTATQGQFRDPIIMEAMIEKAMAMSDYKNKLKSFRSQGLPRGIGMAWVVHGCGFTGSAEQDHIKSVVKLVKLDEDSVQILISNVDMGQGLQTTLRKIVADNLDLPMSAVIMDNPDTDKVPDSGPTVASRSTMIVGGLLDQAAKEMKGRWGEARSFTVIKHFKQPDFIKWDGDRFIGDAYPAYSWGVNVVETDVDPVTLEVTLKGIWSVYDVGRAIDERVMAGQIEGGILQGIGYGMMENMQMKDGRVFQGTVTDYIIPTAQDVVMMENRLMDNPYDLGPYGAKGAGELTILAGAPAVALAIENAFENGIGEIRIGRIPATPEYLMTLLED